MEIVEVGCGGVGVEYERGQRRETGQRKWDMRSESELSAAANTGAGVSAWKRTQSWLASVSVPRCRQARYMHSQGRDKPSRECVLGNA